MNELTDRQKNNQLGMVEESRQLSEIKAKVYMAKAYPRDMAASMNRILFECQNPKLAELATYCYQRGDTEVRGASIRLAEMVARNWGNIDAGVIELEQRSGESTVKTFAWDLESNYRDEKIFTVKHERKTKKGSYQLTDPRDIYEMVANNAARRKRACILAVIPGHVIDEAIEECNKTLERHMVGETSMEEVRAKMLDCFRELYADVTEEMLGEKVSKPFDKIDAKDLVKLRNLYNAINDGFVKAPVVFGVEKEELPTLEEDGELARLNAQLGELNA